MKDLTPVVAVVRSVIRCFYAQSESLGLFSFIQIKPFVSITSCTESGTAFTGFEITQAALSRLTNSLHFCLFLYTVLVCCFALCGFLISANIALTGPKKISLTTWKKMLQAGVSTYRAWTKLYTNRCSPLWHNTTTCHMCPLTNHTSLVQILSFVVSGRLRGKMRVIKRDMHCKMHGQK